jgi:hypothetical protein
MESINAFQALSQYIKEKTLLVSRRFLTNEQKLKKIKKEIYEMPNEKDVNMLTQENIRELPVVVEFVAVPSSFDIDLALSMREGAGMFDGKETNLEHVKFVADTIRASPFMVLSKTPETTIQSAFFCLELFRQLGLTIDSNFSDAHDSKFRGRSWDGYTKFEYAAGHISQRAFVMVIVNLYTLVEEGIMTKVSNAIDSVHARVDKLNENMEMLNEYPLS